MTLAYLSTKFVDDEKPGNLFVKDKKYLTPSSATKWEKSKNKKVPKHESMACKCIKHRYSEQNDFSLDK